MQKMKGESSMTALTLTAATAGAAGISFTDIVSTANIPFFNVPMAVLTMAAAGAGVSFIHGEREPDVKKMFRQILANAFLSVLLVVVVPKMFSLAWVEPGITPALTALVAWSARWALPATIKLMPDIIKRIFKLKEYKDTGEGGSFSSSFSTSLKERYYGKDTEE